MIGIHCDGPECDTWAVDDMIDGFIKVEPMRVRGKQLHFCCRDCCGKYMILHSSPTEKL
jgi:hypothetical protein